MFILRAGLLSQSDGAQHTGSCAELRRLYVAVQMLQYLGTPDVLIQQQSKILPDQIEQMRLLHDSASQQKAARRKRHSQVHKSKRHIMCFERPSRMCGRKHSRRHAPARLHRRSARQTFEAVSVIGTESRKRVARQIVRKAQVTHFRMDQTMYYLAVSDNAAADAGADRHVNEIGEKAVPIPRSAPPRLAKRGGVHIRFEADRNLQLRADSAKQIAIRPTRLGSRRNVSEGGR